MRTSCIRMRAKSRIVILFEDYLEILGGNMRAAMLLALLVYWTDVKIGKKDANLWIWKSHVDFQEDLMFDKEGMKPPHRTTIKSALDLLVEKKFVYRRKNPKMPLDQTKQYLVDQKAVQAAIDALPPIVVLPTLESRNSDIALSESRQSLSENRQCNAEIPTSNTNDYSTVITDPVITEEREGSVFASAPTPPAQKPGEDDYHFYGTEQQHLIWNCHTWCNANHGTCADYVAAIEDGLHERPTDKVPAIPPAGNVTDVTSHSQPVYMQGVENDGDIDTRVRAGRRPDGLVMGNLSSAPGNQDGAPAAEFSPTTATGQRAQGVENDGQLTPTQQTIPSLSQGAAPANHRRQAPDGAASTTPPRSESRASGKRNGKAPVEPVPIPIEAVSILDDWDSLFKKPIARTEKHIQAAVDLVPCHPSKDDLKACMAWLFTTDRPGGTPWFRSHGVKLQDVRDNFGAWQSVAPGEPEVGELEIYSIPWFLARQARQRAQELQA